ncbi:MAG: class I SAM-dependent methyltransferase [Sedimentisphaerales bacterium]|nr:class I SAM-dependent methyltransferase [Sedimentisphaerales bacterium]
MHTPLSARNPHGPDRYGFAWEHIAENAEAHLDFGCSDGWFMESLAAKGIRQLVGMDICRDLIRQGRRRYPHLDIRHIQGDTDLPFAAGTFDSISLLDVIEHVREQDKLLDELYRVLKPAGVLIVTVPGRYALSFLDRGNIQLQWPSLFRWYYLRHHSRREYEYHYRRHPDRLVGCMSAGKATHEHFSRRTMQRLLERSGFDSIAFDGSGYWGRLLDTVDFLLRRPARLRGWLQDLSRRDARRFDAENLFCTTRKPATAKCDSTYGPDRSAAKRELLTTANR